MQSGPSNEQAQQSKLIALIEKKIKALESPDKAAITIQFLHKKIKAIHPSVPFEEKIKAFRGCIEALDKRIAKTRNRFDWAEDFNSEFLTIDYDYQLVAKAKKQINQTNIPHELKKSLLDNLENIKKDPNLLLDFSYFLNHIFTQKKIVEDLLEKFKEKKYFSETEISTTLSSFAKLIELNYFLEKISDPDSLSRKRQIIIQMVDAFVIDQRKKYYKFETIDLINTLNIKLEAAMKKAMMTSPLPLIQKDTERKLHPICVEMTLELINYFKNQLNNVEPISPELFYQLSQELRQNYESIIQILDRFTLDCDKGVGLLFGTGPGRQTLQSCETNLKALRNAINQKISPATTPQGVSVTEAKPSSTTYNPLNN